VTATPHRLPGMVLRDHHLMVPLDHTDPGGEQLELYAREVVAPVREHDDLPWLVFLQGGPGCRADRPAGVAGGWLARALTEFRVLLLDQRGTGRSTPQSRHTVPGRGDATAQARYLRHFRADAIVADCELLRARLAGPDTPWSVLGQSFGGFCALTYLSFAPQGLREVLITGGLAPLTASADAVYERTYAAVQRRSAAFAARYPEADDRAREVVALLAGGAQRLPGGELLTVERFQTLGQSLGDSRGFDELWYLLEDAIDPARPDRLTDPFLAAAHARLSYAPAPLYAAVHEACYAQGPATGWAAQRVRDGLGGLDALGADALGAGGRGAGGRDADGRDGAGLFPWTGEMIYPFLFEQDPALVPLADAAHALAAIDDWEPLYDPAALAANTVPVAATVYLDDMYVDAGFALETAAAVRGLRTWVTNEYQHSGLRDDGGTIFDRLLSMARGTA
jgi:hypothetical protein